jgi:hypothetical protein
MPVRDWPPGGVKAHARSPARVLPPASEKAAWAFCRGEVRPAVFEELICHSPVEGMPFVSVWGASLFHPDSRPAMAVMTTRGQPRNPAAWAADRVR